MTIAFLSGSTSSHDSDLPRSRDEEIDAMAAAAALAFGISRAERSPKISLALATMQAEIDELKLQLSRLNQMLIQAETRADHDALTQIYNRRSFLRELDRFIKLSSRHEIPAYLVYFDLDSFKNINDRYGHAAGDEILKTTGQILKQKTRESDMAARIGGDEFIVLLTHTKQHDADSKASMLRQSIEDTPVRFERQKLQIKVSLGICQLRLDETPEAQIARADKAMYIDKCQRKTQQKETGIYHHAHK